MNDSRKTTNSTNTTDSTNTAKPATATEAPPEVAAEAAATPESQKPAADAPIATPSDETGGPKGLEPTRYGDWEKAGRCSDF